jgi:mono/diheme cytochrome c family protein
MSSKLEMQKRTTPVALMLLLAVAILGSAPASAVERILTLSFGDNSRRFTAAELLARPDAATLSIPRDVSYKRAMTYRAVPMRALIGDAALSGADTIEARASDGFVSQIPADLVKKAAEGGSVPWIAIEDPNAPWPNLDGQTHSAGPFYLVWEHPERSGIGSEQWPFALIAVTAVENPSRRWPQLALDAALAGDAPERRGQQSFITNCMPCHRMNGAGEGVMGPDLGQPMNVTDYVTAAGIRAIVRDPKAVRTWPKQQMTGFTAEQIPDAELDALISFLFYTARR